MLEKKRRDQQEANANKVSAIEQKIENARKRLEEQKKMKSQKAKNVIKGRPQGMASQNADLDDYGYEDLAIESKQRVNNNRFRAQPQKSKERTSHVISEGSRMQQSMNAGQSPARHELGQREPPQELFNLDNDGVSQFTYPVN